MKTTFTAVLGTNFTLGIQEILTVLKAENVRLDNVTASPEVLSFSCEEADIDLLTLQKRLGGTIKLLRNLSSTPVRIANTNPLREVIEYLQSEGFTKVLGEDKQAGKIELGLSVYFAETSPPSAVTIQKFTGSALRSFGLTLKKELKILGLNSRIVFPENSHSALSSVQVAHNKLLSKGLELCLLVYKDKIGLSETVTVQDFEDYGRRDFDRPARDMRRGMTPPKLAQVMLNLAGVSTGNTAERWIVDPFCGVGTFVQEAVLQGFSVLGSDVDEKAIKDSQTNLNWLSELYKISQERFVVQQSSAESALSSLPHPVEAIVTEGTLGPVFSKIPTKMQADEVFKTLSELYSKCFSEWTKTLKKGTKIVMCLPAYKLGDQEWRTAPNLDFALNLGYSVDSPFSLDLVEKWPFLRITKRNTTIYDRKDQIVAREIIVFQKRA